MAVPANVSIALHRVAGADAADLLDWMNGVEANRSELRELVTAYSAEARAHADLRAAEARAHTDLRVGTLRADMHAGLSELRDEMRAGFARVDTRFAQIDLRFSELDNRFSRQELALEKLMNQHLRWMSGLWAATTVALLAVVFARG